MAWAASERTRPSKPDHLNVKGSVGMVWVLIAKGKWGTNPNKPLYLHRGKTENWSRWHGINLALNGAISRIFPDELLRSLYIH